MSQSSRRRNLVVFSGYIFRFLSVCLMLGGTIGAWRALTDAPVYVLPHELRAPNRHYAYPGTILVYEVHNTSIPYQVTFNAARRLDGHLDDKWVESAQLGGNQTHTSKKSLCEFLRDGFHVGIGPCDINSEHANIRFTIRNNTALAGAHVSLSVFPEGMPARTLSFRVSDRDRSSRSSLLSVNILSVLVGLLSAIVGCRMLRMAR